MLNQTKTTGFSSVVHNVLRSIASRRSDRVRRLTLMTLLEMDPERLDDLGVNAQDLIEALHSGRPVVQSLRPVEATPRVGGVWVPAE